MEVIPERVGEPKSAQVAAQPESASPADLAHQRALAFVLRLYEIGNVLARFESVEKTLPSVVAILARALPLHTVILLGVSPGWAGTFVWRAPGETEVAYAAAKAHARSSYAYLLGPSAPEAPDLEALDPLCTAMDAASPVLASEATMLVALPLVVTRGAVFGALQLGAAAHLDEQDLVFMASAVRQIAVALDRKVREDLAMRSREMLAGIVAIASDAIVAIDASLRVVVFNEGAAQIFGCPRDEATGAPLSRLLQAADEALVRDFAADAAKMSERMEIVRRAKLGEELRTELSLSKLTIDGRPVIVLIARDVTERTRTAMAERLLLEAVRAREDLLAGVAHDLRTPLGNILLSTAVLLKPPERTASENRKHLERIQRSAQRLERMITDLLDASTMEGGHFAVDRRRLELPPILAQALESCRPLAMTMGLKVVSEIAPDLPAIRADAARIEQVLDNLLGNAIKFTPSGGSVSLRARRAGVMVCVTVTDTGAGIPRAELPHLFDRFWQARHSARMGVGLGLFLVKGIVQAHGGEICVESEVGGGSTFSFTLPVGDAMGKTT